LKKLENIAIARGKFKRLYFKEPLKILLLRILVVPLIAEFAMEVIVGKFLKGAE